MDSEDEWLFELEKKLHNSEKSNRDTIAGTCITANAAEREKELKAFTWSV